MGFMMVTTVLVRRQLREMEPCRVTAMRGRISSFGTFDRKLTTSPYYQRAIETRGRAEREDGGILFQASLTSAYYTRTEPVRLSRRPQTLEWGRCVRTFALTIMSLTQQRSEAGMRRRKQFASMSQAITDESTGMKGILWNYSDHWSFNAGRTTSSDEVGNEGKRRIQARDHNTYPEWRSTPNTAL